MPTYSYECTECGNRFDIVQAFTDDALTTCEQCSGRLRKLFNSVGIVFKGSGFYRTDSREAGQKAKASTNGSSTSDWGSSSASGDKNGSSSASSEKNGSSVKSSASSTASTAAAST
ncbi:FmdB family transcriptional regulator [Mycobacterium sp. IS-2888]|uniref:FmdB family zinc ribbon protein n=1 Tax=Mycobacterium sp. IS-2888 TaxID=1834159 RepID=UPI00096DD0C5|nr:FmdB family zinc ribbon protein [Mycobacterium sp. IS-2888]OMC45364.1 FmdB family transcriptional regulator [Mycobacterium sp. IS-2888]